MAHARIKPIDQTSVHRITSSQVVVDLQTAVKELVENALDAGATAIDVRIKDNGVKSVEVIDNGSGIAKDDYDTVALKHHTSKLSTFEDLTTVETFGFRGEALASLCAMCDSVAITTATASEAPMGTVLELDRSGGVVSKDRRIARQRGTSVLITGLFSPLPVRRKEFERHAKREYGKALTLLTAYALIPSTAEGGGVKLTVSHISELGKKSVQIQTDGSSNLKNSVTALWGSKAMENVVSLNLVLKVEPDAPALKRRGLAGKNIAVKMSGLVSKFALGCGRSSNDRQFFFVNKRPCNLSKIQKAFNEVYKTFNAAQSPFIVVNFIVPTDACDINVSPDKRTIFLHSEHNLIEAMKAALADNFNDSRSMFMLQPNEAAIASNELPSHPKSGPEPTPPSSDAVISIPSSDPLPYTQPNTLVIPSFDSVEEIHTNSVAFGTKAVPSAPNASSSHLHDHMSITPLIKMEVPDEELTLLPELPRKRPASRSPSASPVRHTASSLRPKKPVQMVLSTTGASWSLNKGYGQTSTKAPRTTPSEGLSGPQQSKVKRTIPKLQSTLSQFRRRGEENVGSEDGDEPIEGVSGSEGCGENETRERATVCDGVGDKKSRCTSRSSRSSMWINSPPSSTEFEPGVAIDDTLEGDMSHTVHLVRDGPMPQMPSTSSDSHVGTSNDTGRPQTSSSQESSVIDATELVAVGDGGQVAERPEEFRRDEDFIIKHMKFDIKSLVVRWNEAICRMEGIRNMTSPAIQDAKALASDIAIDHDPDANPEELLSRVIQKEDFEYMEILGQFNLGFIIVRSRRTKSVRAADELMEVDGGNGDAKDAEIDDLFIVDQHAADEKYNFEMLQATTRIESQRLIRARPLDISASDRIVALENLDILQSNGFEVEVGGLGKDGAERDGDNRDEGGEQLLLVSQPVSKSTVFDMSDLAELLHLMQDKPAGTMVRCSKARAMFASRACRKSVMVGHPLSKAKMTSQRPSNPPPPGSPPYEYDGSTMELPSWSPYNATPP